MATGHCTYPLECELYLKGCGPCPRPEEPYPGISRDSTRALWRMKRSFVRLARAHWLFHTRYLQGRYEEALGRPVGKVIHYGVDLGCFSPAPREECARRLGVEAPTRFTVGLLHSHLLEPRKGILPIIERLGEMAKKSPGRFGLLVVGHGSDGVRHIVPPELPVTVLPFLGGQNELADALNLVDALLYPTRAENLSLTCLSSLACGVPVISYDVGGQGEAIVDDVNGFLVPPGDHEGMLRAMVRMADDPALLKRLREGARAAAVEKFDVERYIDDLLVYYYEILGRTTNFKSQI
jgi:glycosyltransferase involved in cell wall biosynthesis